MPTTQNLKEILSGPTAFYNQDDYLENIKKEFSGPLRPVSYRYQIDSKITQIAKTIFAILILPYTLLHILAGHFVVIATLIPIAKKDLNISTKYRTHLAGLIENDDKWKAKRITVEVDGLKVDALVVGTDETLKQNRWTLASNGNGEFYEQLHYYDAIRFASELKSNLLVYNYPGVGASKWFPTRSALIKTYRAMLGLLEDSENGFGAKEIIGYGHSLGGAIQGEAVFEHDLKEDIKYVFVKSHTFEELRKAVVGIFGISFLGTLTFLLGWNLGSATYSKVLKHAEIILQTKFNGEFVDDGVISKEACLAEALKDDEDFKGIIMGISEGHNASIRNLTKITDVIKIILQQKS